MRTIVKKTMAMLATLLAISILAFLAFQILPGDPTVAILGMNTSPERVSELRDTLGLNDPPPVRYGMWLSRFVTGDMGRSYSMNRPVAEQLADKVQVTATLSMIAFVMVVFISIPSGVFLARNEGGKADRVFLVLNQLLMSTPSVLIGLIFTYLFGLLLRVFTPGQFIHLSQNAGAYYAQMFFPALAIALPRSAMTIKLLRGSIASQMRQDYVRTAYSRGNSRAGALRRHVFRNAIIPVVTFLALTMADIVAGSIIVEQVFVIPGIGRLLLSSISARDFPVVQAIIMMVAVLVVFVNYLADMINQLIDPRIRLG
ncbi:MAG: ABC transporter permease [Clostridiales bacterium]|nr:ABC transporter permease [Clostridiales bacterium]